VTTLQPQLPTLLLAGKGERMADALSAALAQRGLSTDSTSIDELVQRAYVEAPDLIVLIGDGARDGGRKALAALAKNAGTAAIPVALVADSAQLGAKIDAFKHGVVAVVPRTASVDELATNLATLARELPERPGQLAGGLAEASVDELVELLSEELRSGILSVGMGEGAGSAQVVLEADRPLSEVVGELVAKLRPLVGTPDAGPLSYEFYETPAARIGSLDLELPRDGVSDVLQDRRLLLIGENAARSDLLVQELRAAGAQVVVADGEGTGLARARLLDPEVAIVDGRTDHSWSLPALRALRRDGRLRWASLLMADSAQLWRGKEPNVVRLAASIAPLVAHDLELAERAQAEPSFDTRLEVIGPSRLLRALDSTGLGLRVRLTHPRVAVEIDLSEGLVVGASATLPGSKVPIEGTAALATFCSLSSGRVQVERKDAPATTNVMTPLSLALSAAESESPLVAPSLPPPRMSDPPARPAPSDSADAARVVNRLEELLTRLDQAVSKGQNRARRLSPTPARPIRALGKLPSGPELELLDSNAPTTKRHPRLAQLDEAAAGVPPRKREPTDSEEDTGLFGELERQLSIEPDRARAQSAGAIAQSAEEEEENTGLYGNEILAQLKANAHRSDPPPPATKAVPPPKKVVPPPRKAGGEAKPIVAKPSPKSEAKPSAVKPAEPKPSAVKPADVKPSPAKPIGTSFPSKKAPLFADVETPLVNDTKAVVAKAEAEAMASAPISPFASRARTPGPSAAKPADPKRPRARQRSRTIVGTPGVVQPPEAAELPPAEPAAPLVSATPASAPLPAPAEVTEVAEPAQKAPLRSRSPTLLGAPMAAIGLPPRTEPAVAQAPSAAPQAVPPQPAAAPPEVIAPQPLPAPSEAFAQTEIAVPAVTSAQLASSGFDRISSVPPPRVEPPRPVAPQPEVQRSAKPRSRAGLYAAIALVLFAIPVGGAAVWFFALRDPGPSAPRPAPLQARPTVEPSEPSRPQPEAPRPEPVAAEPAPEAMAEGTEPTEPEPTEPEVAEPTEPTPAPPSNTALAADAPIEGRDEDFSLAALGVQPAHGNRPVPPETFNRLLRSANTFRNREQWAQAADLYREVLSIQPENPRATAGLALVHMGDGDHARAIAWAQRLARLHPEWATNFVLLGDAYEAAGDRAAARRSWTHARELDGRLQSARQRLAEHPE
jgi:CheY-like chemotaxis protein